MAFALSGRTITQSGTDADLSGLESISGVEVVTIYGQVTDDYKIYFMSPGDVITFDVNGAVDDGSSPYTITYDNCQVNGAPASSTNSASISGGNFGLAFQVPDNDDGWTAVKLNSTTTFNSTSGSFQINRRDGAAGIDVSDNASWTLVNGSNMDISGTLTINPEKEMLVFNASGNQYNGALRIQNNGTLNVGSLQTQNSARGSSPFGTLGLSIKSLGSESAHFPSQPNLRVQSGGTFNLYAGMETSGAVAFANGSAGTLAGRVSCNRTDTDTSVTVFDIQDADIVIDGLALEGKINMMIRQSMTTPPKFSVVNSQRALKNRYATAGTTVDFESYFTEACNFDFEINTLDALFRFNNRPIIGGVPFVYTAVGEFSSSDTHRYEMWEDIKVKVLTNTGAVAENALVVIRDIVNGSGITARHNYTETGQSLNENYVNDRVYSGFTDENGEVILKVLTEAHVANSADNTIRGFNNRTKSTTYQMDIVVHKGGFSRSVSEVVVAGEGQTLYEVVLQPDANFTADSEYRPFEYDDIDGLTQLQNAGIMFQHCAANNFGTLLTATDSEGTQIAQSTDYQNIPYAQEDILTTPWVAPFDFSSTDDRDGRTLTLSTTATAIYDEDAKRNVTIKSPSTFGLNAAAITSDSEFDLGGVSIYGPGTLRGNATLERLRITNPVVFDTIPANIGSTFSFSNLLFDDTELIVDVASGETKVLVYHETEIDEAAQITKTGPGTLDVVGAPPLTTSDVVAGTLNFVTSLTVTRNRATGETGNSPTHQGRLSVINASGTEVASATTGTFNATTGKWTYTFNSKDNASMSGNGTFKVVYSGLGSNDARGDYTVAGGIGGSFTINLANAAVDVTTETVPASLNIVTSNAVNSAIGLSGGVLKFGITGAYGSGLASQAATNRFLQGDLKGTALYNRFLADDTGSIDRLNILSQDGTSFARMNSDYIRAVPGETHTQTIGYIENTKTGGATGDLGENFVSGSNTYYMSINPEPAAGITVGLLVNTLRTEDIATNEKTEENWIARDWQRDSEILNTNIVLGAPKG